MQLRATRLMAYGRGRSAWTPAQIPTALWLDANDTSTITLNGSTVSQWNDKSGNGRNAVQATAANQPGWGRGRNLILWSEQFQQATWSAGNAVTISANQDSAPDGTFTADKIIATAVNTAHYASQVVSVVNGQTYTLSCYFKAEQYNFAALQFGGAGQGQQGISVNLTTGATSFYNGATIGSATSVGNGWWRVTLTVTSSDSSLLPLISVFNQLGGSGQFFTGNGTGGVYAWGAQLNPGTTVDSYQKTESTAFTDSIGINGKPAVTFDGTTDWMSSTLIANATAETIAVALNRTGTPPFPDSSTILAASASPTGGRHFRFNTSGTLSFIRQSQAVLATSTSVAPTNKSAIVEMTYDNSSAAFYANGVPIGQSAVSPNLVATTTIIGTQPVYFSEFFAGQMAEIIVCQTVLSTGDRQRLEGYLAWKWGGV